MLLGAQNERVEAMTEPVKKLFDIVENEIDSTNEYVAVEKLKVSGLEHEKACVIVETVMLNRSGYFSLFSRLKRLFGTFDIKDVDNLFLLTCQHLLSSGLYQSQKAIDEAILDCEKNFEKLEVEFNYRDDLYHYSSNVKRKIVILSNLHFIDLTDALQSRVVSLLGKEKLIKSIDGRAKYIRNQIGALGGL